MRRHQSFATSLLAISIVAVMYRPGDAKCYLAILRAAIRWTRNGYKGWIAMLACAAICLQVVESSADITLSSSTLTQPEQSLQGTSLLSIQTNRGGASADWGLFSASANLPQQHDQGSPQPSPHYAFVEDRAVSSAMVTDMVAIHDPSRTGTLGYFVPVVAVTRLEMSATAKASHTGGTGGEFSFGDAGFNVYVQGVQGAALFGGIGAADGGSMLRGIQAPQTATMSPVPFIFGESFLLQINPSVGASFQAYGGDNALAAAFATGAASVTVATVWGGFQSITDEHGSVVTGATVTSDTGIDWSNPSLVPWRGSSGSDFGTGSNWYFSAVPNTNQTVLLASGETTTITNANGSNQRLLATSGDTTLRAGDYNLTGTESPSLVVGQNNLSAAAIRLAEGHLDSVDGVVGQLPGSDGSLYVTGAGSSLTASNSLVVGNAGAGNLYVTDGAELNVGTAGSIAGGTSGLAASSVAAPPLDVGLSAGSTGTVQFSRNSKGGLSSVQIGRGGEGSVELRDGSVVEASGTTLGVDSGSNGKLVIDGSTSQWRDSQALSIGVGGKGRVEVKNGGSLRGIHSFVAADDDSLGEIIVRGSGSKFIVSGSGGGSGVVLDPNNRLDSHRDSGGVGDGILNFGGKGAAVATISDGGLLSADGGLVAGVDTGGFASIVVEGSGSRLLAGTLWIGNRGSAELKVRSRRESRFGGRNISGWRHPISKP